MLSRPRVKNRCMYSRMRTTWGLLVTGARLIGLLCRYSGCVVMGGDDGAGGAEKSFAYAYCHGFLSGPASVKGKALRNRMLETGVDLNLLGLNVVKNEPGSITCSGAVEAVRTFGVDQKAALGDPGLKLRLVGSSLGGFIVARYAELYPDEVDRIFMLCTKFGLGTRAQNFASEAEVAEWERTGEKVFPLSTGGEAIVPWTFVQEATLQTDYPAYRCRATIVHGLQDTVVPVAVTRSLVDGSGDVAHRTSAMFVEDGYALTTPSSMALTSKAIIDFFGLRPEGSKADGEGDIEVEAKFSAHDVREVKESVLAQGGKLVGEQIFTDAYWDAEECGLRLVASKPSRSLGAQEWRVAVQGSWLPERELEINVRLARDHESTPAQEYTVRFDGLLVGIDGIARVVLEAAAKDAVNSTLPSQASPDGGWNDRGVGVDRALADAVKEVYSKAAAKFGDDMEQDLENNALREVSGDWLEIAEETCATLVLRRRREILEIYDGRVYSQGTGFSQLYELLAHGTHADNPSGLVASASRPEAEERWLADSAASLVACRVFFDMVELEYAQAACLRANRLGDLRTEEAVEVDLRLAAIAERYGRPLAAVQLYFRVMANPTTSDGERLSMSIIGLTMVPPALMGSLRAIAEFRADWARDLQKLRSNIIAGAMPGELRNAERTPFHLAHQGGPDLEMMSSLAGVYDVAAPSLRYVAPHCRRDTTEGEIGNTGSTAEGAIRIGFFSVHLKNHSVGKMLVNLVLLLAEKPGLEVHVFGPGDVGRGDSGTSNGKPTGSETGDEQEIDPVVQALRSGVHHWHQAPTWDLDLARAAVADAELDVLVYPDLGMEPFTYSMSFARLAPVQCVWWGHPVTPSTGAIDYFLSLDVEVDDGHLDYLEQMVRMDVLNTANFKQILDVRPEDPGLQGVPPYDLDDNTDRSSGQREKLKRRPEMTEEYTPSNNEIHGQEPGAFTSGTTLTGPSCLREYLVLGRLFKLHPDFDSAVEGILDGDRDGCVVLVHETSDEEWTRAVWARLKDVLVPRGVYNRLRIMHYQYYLEALRRATAVLDTFPYGGCLTVLEGLSHGVPVVTLPAKFVRGRFALAIYRQMGYTGLVASDVSEYVSLALRLGKDEAFRKEAVVRVQEGYRVSLHQPQESAREWAAFFVRVSRGGRRVK